MIDNSKCTEYIIPRDDITYSVEFCNVDTSSQLLAVGTESKLAIYLCKFKEEKLIFNMPQSQGISDEPSTSYSNKDDDDDVEDFEASQIYDIQNGCRVTAIAWSPDTSLVTLPKHVRIAACGSDRRIHVFTTDLKGNDNVQRFEGHTDFVNSVTFDPLTGDQLASTGDDKWCRIWGRDGDQQLSFPLDAPGMSVCWHREEPLKVLVAQKNGVIKIFSLSGQQQLMSFDTGQVPLMEADWSEGNKGLLVGAVAGTDWLLFDVSVSSRPVEKGQIHAEGARNFRWSKSHDSLAATVGRPGRQIKVFNTKHQQAPIVISQPITYGISWHQKLPVFATGGDQRVHIYYIENM